MKTFFSLGAGIAALLLLASCGQSPGKAAPPLFEGDARVAVVSNRADLVSGDDVLVEVRLKSASFAEQLQLRRNGTLVTDVLQATADDPLRLLGLVEDLRLGANVISTNIGNSIIITNHPKGGPVFTGPQIQPWECQDSALDDQCNEPAQYSFLYLSSNPDSPGLQEYDPENPPDDVATTTTENGETLPFIVRVEKGFQARDRYEIRTLFKEGEDWTPVNPQSQWNGKLFVTHGGNCRGHHNTSSPRFEDYSGTIPGNPAIRESAVTALGLGWSVLSTSQLNLGHNCNVTYQAESLMMAKERFIEQYGELRYTVGSGCSGGAITQNMIANAYPGLYQGLTTTCTYPDVMSTATQFADYHILLRYFETRADPLDAPENFDDLVNAINALGTTQARDGTSFTITQQNAIYGHENGIVNASIADGALFSEAVDPMSNCRGVPDTVADDPSTRYDQDSNPGGVRCDVLTFMGNIVGARQADRWSQNEQDLGRGFAGFPLGNEGVQYGLRQLQDGTITPTQFLNLNTNIGAVDTNLNLTGERLRYDTPALPNAYRSGIMNTIVNMDTVPIINMTGPDPGAAHDAVHGYWLRYRFEREFGHRDNFVMWGGPTVLIGDPNYMNESLLAMDEWLAAIETDTSDRPIAEKILANKPSTVHDRCKTGVGAAAAERDEMCTEEEMTVFGTPRTSAGDDIFGDMVQCQLRPFSREDDYGFANDGLPLPQADWTEEEWQRLEATFATGVCDYNLRPVLWEPTITWLSYQDNLGQMVTGGEQMVPAEFPIGWASPAFSDTWEPGWLEQ